ncbi:uncharacterized protein Z519_10572 [Cladophialophora bantiana CBS 173.52]|uniref:Flavin reductase like domain-containing protein n=1 Tax=Cladophialophora bantiana (strain ATCC 10958 / CBS 173.52 / CDC B-1940 / NIH 8579) TaxID=1442370 RepID=A0A0D2FR72_CLAB1|nr:uncharacterized protein Z519_10572 [Cladophialophora bantiana CBS 173.52]KIW89087.1 hypothetical protein Z519_10572 [Cladophialophora bantiana CBS 173.52]
MAHDEISPAILYWGTPVVLISTMNPDGSANIGPMSLAWWLGHGCMVGLDASSQTTQNMLRTKQCVLNLASDSMAASVNALARPIGTDSARASKQDRGYQFVKDKFGCGLVLAIEVRILRVSSYEELRLNGFRNRNDADKWKPMIMMFCDWYGLKNGKLKHSRLAEVEEEMYRGLTETTGKIDA